MPDYLAVQFFHPIEYQVTAEVSYPFLTQIYHGALSAYVSFLGVLLCGGKTSVLQHHIIFALLIFVDCCIINMIFVELKFNDFRREIYVAIVACASSLMTACFTQYYIELPASVLLLLAILLMARWIKNGEQKNEVFWMFVLLGIVRVKNDYNEDKFYEVPHGIEICNFGSSHGDFGFDYSELDLNYTCFNFALMSQSLSYDCRIFQQYEKQIDSGQLYLLF